MIKKSFLYGIIVSACMGALLIFNSCNKEKTDLTKNNDDTLSEAIVENGYLNFSNQESLDNYISKLNDQLTNMNSLKSTNSVTTPRGFKPLANKIYRINELKNTSKTNDELNSALFYNELDKVLIPEEIIYYVVDTAKRVKIAGEMYKITESGTFIYSEKNSKEFENLYDNFLENYLNYTSKVDNSIYIYGNIKFIDSYNFVKNENLSVENIIAMVNGSELDENINLKADSEKIISDYTKTYNLTNYRVGGSNKIGQFITNFGLNNWRNKQFDSDHRVNVNLYEIDYGFFKCAGFKCKFQCNHPKSAVSRTKNRLEVFYSSSLFCGL